MSVEGRRASEGRVLLDVALQLGSTLDLDHLLKVVVDRTAEVMDADRALCALFDGRGDVHKAVTHNLVWQGPGHALPVSRGVIARVIAERAPVLISDSVSEEELYTHKSIRLSGLRFVAAAPIIARERVLGVLYVDSKVNVLTEVDEKTDLLNGLTRLVATAVDNAQLFTEQNYRTQLLAELVHDFRAPLAVIVTNARMLQPAAATLDPEAVPMLEDVVASAARMQKMIDTTLALSRVDAGVIQPKAERIDLTAAIRAQVRALGVLARKARLVIAVRAPDEPIAVETLRDGLSIVIDNLVFNAIKHAAPQSTIRVEVATRADAGPGPERGDTGSGILFERITALVADTSAGFAEISVHNEGAPIPPELLPRVFSPYVHGKNQRRGQKSSGLGLSIVAQGVRALGGSCWVASNAEAGTRFSFTLPLQLSPRS